MNVRIGEEIPDFEVEAYVRNEPEPQRFKLSKYRGNWIVLFFYPRNFSFVCPTEIETFGNMEPEFKKEDAVLLGASTDSYYAHKAWYEGDAWLDHINFPIIADSGHALSQAFNVLQENGDDLRGTFIINPEGVLRFVQMNDSDVGRNVQEILRNLQALKQGALCPEGWTPDQPTLTDHMNS